MTKRKHEIEKIWGNALCSNYVHFISGHFMVEDSRRAGPALSLFGFIGWYALVAQGTRVPPDIFFPLWQQLFKILLCRVTLEFIWALPPKTGPLCGLNDSLCL